MSAPLGFTGQRGNGPFFIHIENLPRKYTWQDLKDLIRQTTTRGSWTDMQVFPNGQPCGKGHARVARKEDAYRLYRYLTENIIENRTLRCHLFDISLANAEAIFLHCNCGVDTQSHTPSYSAYIMQVVNQPGWGTLTMTSPLPASQPMPYVSAGTMLPSAAPMPLSPQQQLMQMTQSMASINLDANELQRRQDYQIMQYERQLQLQQAQYEQQRARQLQLQQQQYQRYATNERGIPVNATQGYIRTEARGIFVSGLNFKARTKDIEALFRKAGTIVRIEVAKDSKTERSKGNATIQYASTEEAQYAIRMFDKYKFMDIRLTVRLDREATPITAPSYSQASSPSAGRPMLRTSTGAPTIVNGSQVRREAQEA